ncbi:MAG: hypothetical protein H7832_03825 [Magnetococcus sp. DMHC-6]
MQWTLAVTCTFSPTLHYLYWNEASCVFITTCMLPVALYYQIRMHFADNTRKESLIAACLFGMTIGYQVLNGHPGVLSTYLIVHILIALGDVNRLSVVWLYILSMLVVILLSVDKVIFLWHEHAKFPAYIIREHQGHEIPWHLVLWNVFFKPFFLPSLQSFDSLRQFGYEFYEYFKNIRTINFGGPFALSALLLSPILARQERMFFPLWFSMILTVFLLMIPGEFLPDFISSSWTWRDPVNLLGALLGAMGISCLLKRPGFDSPGRLQKWVHAVLVVQMLMMFFGNLPSLIGQVIFPSQVSFHHVGEYNAALDSKITTSFTRILKREFGEMANEQDPAPRMMYAKHSLQKLRRRHLVKIGLVPNVLILHGFAELYFISKGISQDRLAPSWSIPYGQIGPSENFNSSGLDMDEMDWPLQSQSLLTLLGVQAVVSMGESHVHAKYLEKVETVREPLKEPLSLYRNTNYWPNAIVLADEWVKTPLNYAPICKHKTLICLDVTPVVENTDPKRDPVNYKLIENGFLLTLAPSTQERWVLVTNMFLEDWRAWDKEGRSVHVQDWYGLVLVKVPSGADMVRLSAVSDWRMPRWIFAILVQVAMIIFLVVHGWHRWHQRGSR